MYLLNNYKKLTSKVTLENVPNSSYIVFYKEMLFCFALHCINVRV